MTPQSQTLFDLLLKLAGAVLAPVLGLFVQRRLLRHRPVKPRQKRRERQRT